MKKFLTLILALSMITMLSACADDNTESTNNSEGTTLNEEITDVSVEETTEDNENSASGVLPEGTTFAGYLLEDFKTMLSSDPDMTAQQLASELSTNEMILFSSMTMPVEEGFLSGFSQEITGFESAEMFGPAMGSIAFIGYVFELADENAAKDFTEVLTASADPRWQICVEAEETICEAVGNKVLFIMAPMSNQ